MEGQNCEQKKKFHEGYTKWKRNIKLRGFEGVIACVQTLEGMILNFDSDEQKQIEKKVMHG